MRSLGHEGRELAELVDDLRHFFNGVIHFILGVVSAEAKADGAVGGGEGYTHRPQDMRRLQRAGGAG